MIEAAEISCPRLSLETLRFLVAEDDSAKVGDITASLDSAGLLKQGNLTVAGTLEEAENIIDRQTPGNLEFNVFLLDGNLDGNRTNSMHHGAKLLGKLVEKYYKPIIAVMASATEQLKDLGLSSRHVEAIILPRGAREVAAERLALDALFVGISRVREGSLCRPAQHPWIPYREVGAVIATAVLSPKEKKWIQGQQRRKEQAEQAEAIRLTRAK